jgi:hypothetical protein
LRRRQRLSDGLRTDIDSRLERGRLLGTQNRGGRSTGPFRLLRASGNREIAGKQGATDE